MRPVSGTALVLATLVATLSARPVQSQIGGFIKKKAVEAAKGKEKDEAPMTSSWKSDSCGTITPEKMKDLLRGLQAEGAAREAYDAMVSKAESNRVMSDSAIKACRDAEAGGPDFRKIMIEGFDGPNPPSTTDAVQKQMARNNAKYAEFVDKKCGKDPAIAPSVNNAGAAYRRAHAEGAKAAGMSEACYAWLADPVIAFCKLSKDDQKTAVEKGLRAGNTRNWLFTADEARAIQPYCDELMPALKKAGNVLAS